MNVIVIFFLLLVAYLLGSIPSSVWIGKRFYGIDVREHGSHNAGATNTLRVLGAKAAAPVFAIDVLKGFAAVSLAHLSSYEAGGAAMYNLQFGLIAAAVLGHMFPIFAGFRGGKGVATLVGAIFGLSPGVIGLSLLVFAIVLGITHYVSLGSLIGGFLLPIFSIFVFHQTYLPLIIFYCCVAVLLVFTHRKNIKRLINGTENKIYLFKSNRTKE